MTNASWTACAAVRSSGFVGSACILSRTKAFEVPTARQARKEEVEDEDDEDEDDDDEEDEEVELEALKDVDCDDGEEDVREPSWAVQQGGVPQPQPSRVIS
mmetsp:Transcript_51657/g.112244  ORF Transcript_51657/g.112244 Transcript_51657/m.112244 type:complete len:101 (-) Transcript_51657:696-998(-)